MCWLGAREKRNIDNALDALMVSSRKGGNVYTVILYNALHRLKLPSRIGAERGHGFSFLAFLRRTRRPGSIRSRRCGCNNSWQTVEPCLQAGLERLESRHHTRATHMAHFKILPLWAALLLVAACSQPGVKASQPVATETQAPQPVEGEIDPEKAAKAEAALPKQPLTPEILFKFLVAEVAGQRGAIGLAQSTYLDLARQTQDPRIARRAAEVSMFARDQAGALEATRLWAAGEQDSERAQQTLAALLLNRSEEHTSELQ